MGASDELLAKLLAMKAQEKPTDKDIKSMRFVLYEIQLSQYTNN